MRAQLVLFGLVAAASAAAVGKTDIFRKRAASDDEPAESTAFALQRSNGNGLTDGAKMPSPQLPPGPPPPPASKGKKPPPSKEVPPPSKKQPPASKPKSQKDPPASKPKSQKEPPASKPKSQKDPPASKPKSQKDPPASKPKSQKDPPPASKGASEEVTSIEEPPAVSVDDPSGCGACTVKGVVYRVEPGYGCTLYTSNGQLMKCPLGYLFDPRVCGCNAEGSTKCPVHCSTHAKPPLEPNRPPATVLVHLGCAACEESGVAHSVVAGSDCRVYTKELAGMGPVKHECTGGLAFDPVLCMCNYAHVVKCPSSCLPATPTPATMPATTPSKATPATSKTATPPPLVLTTPRRDCGWCKAQGGIAHRIQAGEGCKYYTMDTTGDSVRYSCPSGLLFDPVLCMCNYDHVVKCPMQCGGGELPMATTPATTEKPTSTPPTPSTTAIMLTTPPHDCGSCYVQGTMHRVKAGDGCKQFTKDSTGSHVHYSCPSGLLFDPVLCMCNYDHVVKCPSQCGIGELHVATTPATTEKPTSARPTPSTTAITLGTPPSDCGSCFIQGTTHRVKAGDGCKYYTKESTGSHVHYSCPGSLLFDPVLCMCNYAHVVKCPTTCQPDLPVTSPTTQNPTTPATPLSTKPTTPIVLTRPPQDCGMCYALGSVHRVQPGKGCQLFTKETASGDIVEYSCSGDLLFDPVLCMCNYAHVVRCPITCGGSDDALPATSEKPTVPTLPTEPPTQPPTPSTTLIKLNTPPHDCGSCVARGVVHRVSPGLGCMEFTEEAADGGSLAHFTCSGGLLFDPVLCMCNYAHVVQCPTKCGTDAPTTAAPTTPTTPATKATTPSRPSGSPVCGICAAAGIIFEIVAGTSCTAFAEHAPGVGPVRYDCPDGLAFDQTLCVCNWKHAVTCPRECGGDGVPPSTPAITPSTTTSAPMTTAAAPTTPMPEQDNCGVCKSEGNVYRLVRGSGCRKFSIQTTSSAGQVLECPTGLTFDLNLCVCNYDHAVTCSKECSTFINPPTMTSATIPTPKPTTPVVVGKPTCGVCQSDGITYEIVENTGCTTFTQQAAGMIAKRYDCPANLAFDANLCVCNWKEAVQCTAVCDGRPPVPPVDVATSQPPTPSRWPVPTTHHWTPELLRDPTNPTATAAIPTRQPTNSVVVVGNPSCGVCHSSGITYEIVENTGCTAFTQRSAGTVARRYECPDGLAFDVNLCVCNWKEAVQCKAVCDGRPPVPPVDVVTSQAPTPSRTLPPATTLSTPELLHETGCKVCTAGSNVFRPVAGSGCRKFSEQSSAAASANEIECPAGLLFDTHLCLCNYDYAVKCTSDCDTTLITDERPTPRPHPSSSTPATPTFPAATPSCGVCTARGIIFEIVADSGCASFTERAPGIEAKRYDCPAGLAFDTYLCVCNWKEAVTCSSQCDGRPPGPIIVVPPVQPTTERPLQPVTDPPTDLLVIPDSGCGACQAGGSTYRSLPGCRSFTEVSDVFAARKLDCPAGLIFDTTLCVCNYEYAVKCASDCGSVPRPPTIPPDVVRPPTGIVDHPPIVPNDDGSSKVIIGCGSCQAGGNIYRTVGGSGCMVFTEEAPGIAARRYACPAGLVFDTNLCVCNWREAVQCSASCGGQPPAINTTPNPHVNTPPPGRPPVDQFIPNSGCRACQAGGNTYRALPGCRSFTEESNVVAARKLDCPAGLVFDTTLCICNYEYAIKCASDCGSVPRPPTIPPDVVRPPTGITDRPPIVPSDGDSSKVVIGCGACQAGGNTYRTLAGSGCMAFTEEAPGIAARRYVCPDGLVFDTNLCVCNWREVVQCSASCGVQPPLVATTLRPPQNMVTQHPGRPTVDQFIPSSGCRTCDAHGSTYRALPGCRSFADVSDVMVVRKLDCPAGLMFDTALCACNYDYAVKCAADCGSELQPPTIPTDVVRPPGGIVDRPPTVPNDDGSSKVVVGCGVCQAGGNTYRTVTGSGCMAFTEEAPGIAPRRNICPDGLAFDTNLCVCNWREAVQCSAACNVQPPSSGAGIVTSRPPQMVETLPPGRPPVDQFVPVSGCGTCKAGGSTYRPLPGCRSFTQETETHAATRKECPDGLIFDSKLCVCNYVNAVTCSATCHETQQSQTQPPAVPTVRPPVEITDRPPIVPSDDGSSKVTIGCGSCQAGGNVYRTVAGSGCTAFTEEAPGIAPRRNVCPDGLVFDTNLCVCNWREAVQCLATCGSQPPATKTELVTPKPPSPVVQVNAGCGSCKTGCTVFRVLEDGGSCNAFIEDTEGAPSPLRKQCPLGLAFDAELCMCSWKDTTKCTCGAKQPALTSPPKVEITPRPNEHVVTAPANIDGLKTIPSGCGTCEASGIIFRTVPGTGCASFTKETAFLPATRFECNSGLVFDVSICQCNRKEAVSCSCVGGSKP